jgi:putative FmdB family regulatory protein
MPVFEFICNKCHEKTTRLCKRNEIDAVTCSNCQGNELEQIISKSSFSLKGSGWYSDGYNTPTDATTKPSSDDSKK